MPVSDFRDFLFELGTEELPPKSLKNLASSFHANVTRGLDKLNLAHGAIQSYATPRRLAIYVSALASEQPEQLVERRGPALQAAYQGDGTPTKATEGFARSCGVRVDELSVIRTDKGAWVGLTQRVAGSATADLLPDLVRQSLADLPIAKRMRWGSGETEFVRPVHWTVLLFGDQVLDAEILGSLTGRLTRGHRFHRPDPFPITAPSRYAAELLEHGKVMVSFDERRRAIERMAHDAARDVQGHPYLDDDLLDEVSALVEWPVPVLGRFDARYLSLPAEVLITTMQANQKYFPVLDSESRLLPYFITFSNLESRHIDTVRLGNERVIVPRLTDAEFFWNQDRRRTLDSRTADLAAVTYQKTLGSLLDKTRRVESLAATIAHALAINDAPVRRAAHLAKADLLTEMVGEFPNLQGTMGRYYARAEGESDEVAQAIEEHYQPRVSGGALPASTAGRVLALADKCETLAGIFSTGLLPSGDRDPFGLRRAALGMIRILIEQELDLDIRVVFEHALTLYDHPFDRERTMTVVCDFVLERLRGYCLDQGYAPDEVESVLCLKPARPLDAAKRLDAVREFRGLTASDSLAGANKRIRNLLRRSDETVAGTVNEELLSDPLEQALFQAARAARGDLLPLLQQADYRSALARLAQLREPVDAFFDHVLVMAPDPELRRNRLGLLALIENLFLDIADVGCLQPRA
jgi:glycyl-tRNA synthetase beta chain